MNIKIATQVEAALDAAKGFWPRESDEPLVSSQVILLRELCHALEILLDNLPAPDEQYDPLAYRQVLECLSDGDLVAVTLETDTIIPTYAWSFVDADQAFDSNFWYGRIIRDCDCHGFIGQLPMVPRDKAVTWLSQVVSPKTQKHVHRTRESLELAFREYVASFDGVDPPKQVERDAWRKEHGITRDRLRELCKDHAPEDWTRPGRKRTTYSR